MNIFRILPYFVCFFSDMWLCIHVCLCLLLWGPAVANWCLPWSNTVVNTVTLAPQWVESPDNITRALQPTVIRVIKAVTHQAAWSGPRAARCEHQGEGAEGKALKLCDAESSYLLLLKSCCWQSCLFSDMLPPASFLIPPLWAWRCVLTKWMFFGMM